MLCPAEEVKIREEKWLRLQNELRHLIESLAIMLSSPSRFVESSEGCIKERIREILSDNKDLVVVSRAQGIGPHPQNPNMPLAAKWPGNDAECQIPWKKVEFR